MESASRGDAASSWLAHAHRSRACGGHRAACAVQDGSLRATGELPSPPSVATDTCWGSQKDNRIDTEHFSVQWDDGIITETQAQNFADSLEESWEIEINELGWKKPAKSSQYLMLVIVDNLGSGAGRTPRWTVRQRIRPYVVAGKGSFSAGDWYKTMACHGSTTPSSSPMASLTNSVVEASATWVEDLVYPD